MMIKLDKKTNEIKCLGIKSKKKLQKTLKKKNNN
jgi:hypothetical protein